LTIATNWHVTVTANKRIQKTDVELRRVYCSAF